MTPERRIQNIICSYLKTRGIFIWINETMGTYDKDLGMYRRSSSPYKIKGTSDILGILPGGRFLAIEVKTPTGRVSPEQKKYLEDINAWGGYARVARSLDDIQKDPVICDAIENAKILRCIIFTRDKPSKEPVKFDKFWSDLKDYLHGKAS